MSTPLPLPWLNPTPSSVWSSGEATADTSTVSLSPPWRMFILGDGSPTRHLHMLSGSPTVVDVLDMSEVVGDDGAPEAVMQVRGPRLRRQVYLENKRGERLGYATSWWNAKDVDSHLTDRKLPIWTSLASHRTEVYREILTIHVIEEDEQLAAAFGLPGPYWGRSYLFWHGGAPMCLIFEVFSPLLCKYLGPLGETPGV